MLGLGANIGIRNFNLESSQTHVFHFFLPFHIQINQKGNIYIFYFLLINSVAPKNKFFGRKNIGGDGQLPPLSPLNLRLEDAIYPVPELSFKIYCQRPKKFPKPIQVQMSKDAFLTVLRA
jgi:hypothetical protein